MTYSVTNLPVVVIDAGHGGRDPGAVSHRGIQEKSITLNVSQILRDLLTRAGFSVIMTRDKDVALGADVNSDLQARCNVANSAGANVFLSIHCNAGGGRGSEIYVYQDGGAIRPLAQAIVDNVATIMGYHGEPIKDGSGLYVIRNTSMPAMLLEIGYMDSDDIDKLLANVNNFAHLISDAFCQFYGVKKGEYEMKVEDANKLIDTFLKPAWNFVQSEADKKEIGRLADELRKASGQPTQNS